MIEIVEPGLLATVQDLGRSGYAALGVPRAGAVDRSALRLANRLVGNAEDAAAIEVTLGGLTARLADAATVAVTGAVCPGAPDWGVATSVPAGTTLRFGTPVTGLRSYLAVRGGIAVDEVLGSRSTDTLSGLGPAALRAGDVLPVGRAGGQLSGAGAGRSIDAGRVTPLLGIRFGPRADWFSTTARRRLVGAEWLVRSDSDRIGIRLDGPPLERTRTAELPSEPILPGALQVPPDGRPILFGPDAPVTGGYPVIAVVDDLDRAAQVRPGDMLRFRRAAGSGQTT